MATTSRFTCAIQPTQALYDNPWHVERTTTDGSGALVKIVYECRLVYSMGAWTLYITMPGSRYPFSQDLLQGDELHVVQAGVGTGEEDKGSVQVHASRQLVGTYWITTYSYTADMLRTTP